MGTSFQEKIDGLETANRKDEKSKELLSFRKIPIMAGLGCLSILWYNDQNRIYYELERARLADLP